MVWGWLPLPYFIVIKGVLYGNASVFKMEICIVGIADNERRDDGCRVSAVVVAGSQRERAERALKSIVRQEGFGVLGEAVLVDVGGEDVEPLPSAGEPGVRVIHRTERAAYGVMRAEAVHAARGEIIAFIEEHAAAMPGWMQGIVAVYDETKCVGASGEVHNLNPGAGISDAVAMMNYYDWLPPVSAYDADILVGHNATYLRSKLLEFGDELPRLLDGEPVLQTLLIRGGGRLRIDPRIRVAHQNETETRAISRGYYLWNRCFGARRITDEGWSPLYRLCRLLTTPLVPPVRVLRTTVNLARSKKVPLTHVLRYWPAMFAAQSGAALGLALGYSVGAGNADRKLGDYELDIHRGPVEPF